MPEQLVDAASATHHTLPSNFRDPPVPTGIYRRLKLWARRDGLHIRSINAAAEDPVPEYLEIQWGLKGRIMSCAQSGPGKLNGNDLEGDESIEIGGILGRVHLWDTSYLLFFIAPPESSRRFLLPTQESIDFPDDLPSLTPLGSAQDELRRLHLASMPERERSTARASQDGKPSGSTPDPLLDRPAHIDTQPSEQGIGEYWTLKTVHALPMQQKAAEDLFSRLTNLSRRGQNSSNQASPQAKARQEYGNAAQQDGSNSRTATAAFVNALNPQNWRLPMQVPNRPPFTSRPTQSNGGDMSTESAAKSGPNATAEDVMSAARATQTLENRQAEDDSDKDFKALVQAEGDKKPSVSFQQGEESLDGHGLPPTVTAASATQRRDLEAKIVREMCRDLGDGTFFYSYDTDISRSLQHKREQLDTRNQSKGLLTMLLSKSAGSDASVPPGLQEEQHGSAAGIAGSAWVEPDQYLPLCRRFDPRFLWNAFLMRDFLDGGLHNWVLPIMQGWIQSTRFYIPPTSSEQEAFRSCNASLRPSLDSTMLPPSTPVDLVVISRRSKDRAGLRFQRRGIDEAGNVANFVETEQIIRIKAEGRWNVFSFVLLRGSIPLFWSQTSTLTTMKPPPVLDRSVAESLKATRQHFDDLKKRYGAQAIVNLAETTGKEGTVTLGFKQAIKELGDDLIEYHEFDFHHECQGMHYENISKLINALETIFAQQGYYWTCQGEVMREQQSTFRVNCIDCLDRTAVVQSAFARHVLDSQMTQVGIVPDSLVDSSTRMVFNDVWANNGDAISRAYAGTSALKGDFTRTGKRDLTGMMHDGLNSMARMYSGAVSDFFAQAVISFMVGERSKAVFSELMESLQSSDTSNVLRLARARAAAIETSSARVIDVGESFQDGLVMLTPTAAKMEERVVLLSSAALYLVEYHWTLEKVVQSTRVPLSSLTSLKYGAYITRPVTDAGRDPAENSGLLLTFDRDQVDTRATNYSVMNDIDPVHSGNPPLLGSADDSEEEDVALIHPVSTRKPPPGGCTFAAKAIPVEGSSDKTSGDFSRDKTGGELTCQEAVNEFVLAVQRAMARLGLPNVAMAEDVVSLSDAQKHISLGARADYALKRLLWLP